MLIDRKQTLEEGRIRVPFVSTVDNYADFFTTPINSSSSFGNAERIMIDSFFFMNLHERRVQGR